MYKLLVKPLFFLFSPESIHHFVFKVLKFISFIPGVSMLLKMTYSINDKRLTRNLFGLTFKNPVGLAAGFDKNAILYNELANLGFGFIEIGTITPKAQPGNPKPRLFRIVEDEGIINRMGINNEGAESAVKRLKNRKTNIIIGGNISKNTTTNNDDALGDYITNFTILHDYVDYFVLNVSCPNVKDLTKLQDTDFLLELITSLQKINSTKNKPKPILLKIAPDLNNSQLDEIIELVNQTKVDGVIATNTTNSREGLKTSKEKIAQIANGGLSGQPLKARSTEVIKYLADNSNKSFPIIGVGGIHSPEDAIEKLEAGADLIQIYTGFIYEGPSLVKRINKKILAHYG